MEIQPLDYIDIKYLPISWLNKDSIFEKAQSLYTQGKGSLKFWISTMGVDVDDYLSLMEEELEEDFENKFPIHATSATFSGNDNKGGRPLMDEKDLSINGKVTRTTNSNNQVKPSTK